MMNSSSSLLDRKNFLIREHASLLKFSDTYDIFDPETQQRIGVAQERPGTLIHLLRFVIHKRILPTKVFVYQGESADAGNLLFSIQRGVTFLRQRIEVMDGNGQVVGWFIRKLLSIGGAFRVFDAAGNEVAQVKGDWKGWNFTMSTTNGLELGTVSKKWAGLGKELFTSADNYVIALTPQPQEAQGAKGSSAVAMLLLAAGLAIDTVFKEKK